MNSRRAILKLIGVAPAAASAAASQLAPMLSSPAVVAASALGTQAAGEIPQPSYGLLGPVLGKQVQKLMRQTEDEIYLKRAVRLHGLDGDLGSMRSVSRARKERQQFERGAADSGLLRHANSVMWGN